MRKMRTGKIIHSNFTKIKIRLSTYLLTKKKRAFNTHYVVVP